MELKVPESLRLEHVQLRRQLYQLTREADDLSSSAREVMELFYKHYLKEEERVFPALQVLPLLAEGKITGLMRSLPDIAAEMKGGLYGELLEDHKLIVAALKKISETAALVGRKEYVEYADQFILHAQLEEEVLYPATMVIGEYFQAFMNDQTNV